MTPARLEGPTSASTDAIAERWRRRYAPDVLEVVEYRRVEAPRVTIIVVSYRAGDYLVECLEHARGQTARGSIPFEVILADSGGIDHLRSRTAGLVDVDLRLTDGISLNAARNAAMAHARGDYVAYVDDDGLIAPTFVDVACRVLADPGIAALRGRIVAKHHPWFTALSTHYDRGDEMIDDVLSTEGHMAVKRAMYLAVGGFPDGFYGGEGAYLAYQLTRSFPGTRVVYAPDLLMRHDYFDSWSNFVWKTRKYTGIRRTVGQLEPDPEWLRFLDEYLRRPKRERPLTSEQKLARALLKAARWGVTRLPDWAANRIAKL